MFNNAMFKWFGIIFSLAAPVLCKVTARGRQSREPSREKQVRKPENLVL